MGGAFPKPKSTLNRNRNLNLFPNRMENQKRIGLVHGPLVGTWAMAQHNGHLYCPRIRFWPKKE